MIRLVGTIFCSFFKIGLFTLGGGLAIVSLVQSADQYQSVRQKRREQLASRIVPWNFLLAGIVAIVTRSIVKTSAALMVDYSCAIKLATPLAILSAMREGIKHGVLIKGGKYIEALASADTIVFLIESNRLRPKFFLSSGT